MSSHFKKSMVRVLVADDEESIRNLLKASLSEEGWQVETAEDGQIALNKLKEKNYHIILSDINMPEVTGMDLLEFTKQKYPNTEFVVMTSNATLETAIKAIRYGAYDYLNKPFEDVSVVSQKLEKVAEKIFLRQQNQELLKRLKSAAQDLKKLISSISKFNGLLSLEELRKTAMESLKELLEKDALKAVWFSKEEGEWSLKEAIPGAEAFEGISTPDELEKSDVGQSLHKLEFFDHTEVVDILFYESVKESIVEVFSQELMTCYEKVRVHKEIASLANRDGLTRLYNHRYLQERFRQELLQARRQKSPLSVLMIDIDHFKNFNDTHGHPAGDKLLKEFAALLNEHRDLREGEEVTRIKRETDIVARYGGEEFVMILPFTPYEGGMIKAQRLQQAVAKMPFEHAETQPLGFISISVGVASFPDHGESTTELLEKADKALYLAKQNGRNQARGALELTKGEAASPLEDVVDLHEEIGTASEESSQEEDSPSAVEKKEENPESDGEESPSESCASPAASKEKSDPEDNKESGEDISELISEISKACRSESKPQEPADSIQLDHFANEGGKSSQDDSEPNPKAEGKKDL